jgi:NADPH-dependent curcumin reductase CurA
MYIYKRYYLKARLVYVNKLQAITAPSVGRVIRSRDSNFKEGDLVHNPFSPAAEYYVVPAELLIRKVDPSSGVPLPAGILIRKVDPSSGVPLPDFLSSLGNIFFLGLLFGGFFFFLELFI